MLPKLLPPPLPWRVIPGLSVAVGNKLLRASSTSARAWRNAASSALMVWLDTLIWASSRFSTGSS